MAHPNKHLDELLQLSREERAAAAEVLLESLEGDDPDEDVAEAWATEIRRRIDENAPGIPADQVFAEGRARLKNRP